MACTGAHDDTDENVRGRLGRPLEVAEVQLQGGAASMDHVGALRE
jgi:hypothetical protein